MGVSSRGPHAVGLHSRGIEEACEYVESRPVDGVGYQQFPRDIRRFDPLLLRQRMVHRHRHLRLVAEQRKVGETALLDRIGGDHEVQVAAE